MYIHLGQNTAVRLSSVIAIFDMENTTTSKKSREFLEKAEITGKIYNVSEELPKSYVICEENGDFVVYISPVASSTILKRSNISEYYEQA